MRRLVLLIWVAACGGSNAGEAVSTTSDTGSEGTPNDDGDDADDGGSPTTGNPSTTSPIDSTDTGDDAIDSSGSGDGEPSDSSSTGDEPPLVGCPDDLPASWILCEDFEAIDDPWAQFGTWVNIDGALAIEEGPSVSGTHAYRVEHRPTTDWVGWLEFRFGQGPGGGTVHRPNDTFDEVWVRFWVNRDAAWPDGGFGDLVEVQALAPTGSAIAADATVLGPTGSPTQRAIAWSCVHNGVLMCDGDDWVDPDLQALTYTSGTTPIFGAATAGQWQCVEVRMRLDAPGAPGEFDVWIDGELDTQLDNLAWLQSWSVVGINNVRFSSWWPGVPNVIERYIDDVVVATAPIGCD